MMADFLKTVEARQTLWIGLGTFGGGAFMASGGLALSVGSLHALVLVVGGVVFASAMIIGFMVDAKRREQRNGLHTESLRRRTDVKKLEELIKDVSERFLSEDSRQSLDKQLGAALNDPELRDSLISVVKGLVRVAVTTAYLSDRSRRAGVESGLLLQALVMNGHLEPRYALWQMGKAALEDHKWADRLAPSRLSQILGNKCAEETVREEMKGVREEILGRNAFLKDLLPLLEASAGQEVIETFRETHPELWDALCKHAHE
jgi:hypothetical protein